MKALKDLVKLLLREAEANSRFVFLLHGLAGAFGIMAVAVAYLIPHFPDKAMGPEMIMGFGGVSGVAAVGRWATKVGDGKQGDVRQGDGH